MFFFLKTNKTEIVIFLGNTKLTTTLIILIMLIILNIVLIHMDLSFAYSNSYSGYYYR